MGQERIVGSHVMVWKCLDCLKDDFIKLPDVFTQKCMPVTKLNIPKQEDVDRWPYLRGIELP